MSSTIVPTTPSERSQHPIHHHHHCSTEKPSARAPSSFISHVFLKIQKRNEKRNFELRRIQTFFVFHDRSDDAFGTISVQQSMGDFIIIIAPRRTARTFLFYISRIFVAIDTKTKRKKKLLSSAFARRRFLSSTIVPTTPSERSQHYVTFSSSLLLAEPRAHLLLLYLTYFCCNRYKNETKKETFELRVVLVR